MTLGDGRRARAAAAVIDVDVTIEATHTWIGDLDFRLRHAGIIATILDNPGLPASQFGCGENNITVILDEEGTGPVETVCNPAPPAISSPPFS